ncbi:hypothetical protein RB2463 [Rhodopirellula baltica SH 1]|uniref:Uncharacterized protein n=1 Tax=Rhodopirellula baltica (strain DSM 10527 / NCIMB 13988 / SH1) TaxID=243090 RepID=Q7UVT0_RHOBA|nr:hypothetical protein RB2463 [Rhodopirellula baltica SH 1]
MMKSFWMASAYSDWQEPNARGRGARSRLRPLSRQSSTQANLAGPRFRIHRQTGYKSDERCPSRRNPPRQQGHDQLALRS